MNQYYQERATNLLALRALPRSFGLLVGGITFAVEANPEVALGNAIAAWFLSYILKSLLPAGIVDTNLWTCCSMPTMMISSWVVKWPIYVILILVGLMKAAPLSDTLLLMGGLLAWDAFVVFRWGS